MSLLNVGYLQTSHPQLICLTTTDIHNHMYKARMAMQLSKFDRENLAAKINEWRKHSPEYFRPFSKSVTLKHKALPDINLRTRENAVDSGLFWTKLPRHPGSWHSTVKQGAMQRSLSLTLQTGQNSGKRCG